MATSLEGGRRTWSMARDAEGHREYKIKHLVRAAANDGPANVIRTPGLPVPGGFWFFGIDLDPWAICRPNATVQPHPDYKEGTLVRFWIVENTYSTKPDKRCNETEIEDPLLEPMKISGSFVNKQREATRDRHGKAILTSSHEIVRGAQVEFDEHAGTVRIEQNVPILQLGLFSRMVNTVNDAPLWGMPARCVKLSNAPWAEHYYGTCYRYFTRMFEFDVSAKINQSTGLLESGFDRDLLDEGGKALHGHWDETTGAWTLDNINSVAPDRFNPAHFDKVKDKSGENMRVILDGTGKPINAKTMGVITLASDASPIEITSATHGLATGSSVAVFDVGGNTAANGKWVITVIDANTFSLDGSAGNSAYTSGGFWYDLSGPGNIHVEKYSESNLLLLGIPVFLG